MRRKSIPCICPHCARVNYFLDFPDSRKDADLSDEVCDNCGKLFFGSIILHKGKRIFAPNADKVFHLLPYPQGTY